jgi:hypothetical protein
MAFIAGAIITVTKKYRPTNWIAWCITIVGLGVLSLLREDSSTGMWVGVQLVSAVGTGMLVRILFLDFRRNRD